MPAISHNRKICAGPYIRVAQNSEESAQFRQHDISYRSGVVAAEIRHGGPMSES